MRRDADGRQRFSLFSEMFLAGVLIAVASAALVTFLPAMAAGVAHLRRHINGESDSVRRYAKDVAAAWREGWRFAASSAAVCAVLLLNVALAAQVPGGMVVAPLAALVAVIAVVVALRTAACWSSVPVLARASWPELMRTAARHSAEDLSGSMMVVLAIGMCAMFVWMLLPLIAVVPGLLALALVAIEDRRVRSLA